MSVPDYPRIGWAWLCVVALASLSVRWPAYAAGTEPPAACAALSADALPFTEPCPHIPTTGAGRRAALEALDDAARAAVREGRHRLAVDRFRCLMRADATSASAANIAILWRELFDRERALTAARCAEALAPDGDSRRRARARTEEIERRLTPAPAAPGHDGDGRAPGSAPAVSLVPDFEPVTGHVPRSAADDAGRADTGRQPASWIRPAWGWAFVLAAASTVVAASLYAAARGRGVAFQDEQARTGHSTGAVKLRSQAETLQAGSIGAAAAAAAFAGTGFVLLSF